MVVKMMTWRPWPATTKYEVKLTVRRLEIDDQVCASAGRFTVEIRWKGQKVALSALRRSVKRNFTKEESVGEKDGAVFWDEEFKNVCGLSDCKDGGGGVFNPWEITFTVWNGTNRTPKSKVPAFGTASLNLADLASDAEAKDFELNIPLTPLGNGNESPSTLCVALSLLEIRTSQERPHQSVQRSVVPVSSPENIPGEEQEVFAIKASLRKVKTLTNYVSAKKPKKSSHEEDGSYPYDSDSMDEFEEGDSDERKDESSLRKSLSYGTLPYAIGVGGSFYHSGTINSDDEDWVYYSNRKSDMGCSRMEESTSESSKFQSSKLSILKRKFSFRSSNKARGEPLLKMTNGEEGGDDIDYDRRQLSSDDWGHKFDGDSTGNLISEFGDDQFAVGSWEQKEVISRDGQMKLQTQVFFASIDQRSERAAGESACTALVAVIADWFQTNRDILPIKSQFDSIIREGSLEWRNLCENQTYKERFPDKHFDLETVLQAKIRPLSVSPSKSFIGFFHPDGMDEGKFNFLQGAMSFDSIWEEISRAATECTLDSDPQIYVVSWNDHFFVLKVEQEAYYIIDTLGERLHEGCNQAYILKFDKATKIHKKPDQKSNNDNKQKVGSKEDKQKNPNLEKSVKDEEESEVVCEGKESCKEYIKSFLAAIPIRELLVDIKKGLMATIPLHHRLQIEFHYTRFSEPIPETSSTE